MGDSIEVDIQSELAMVKLRHKRDAMHLWSVAEECGFMPQLYREGLFYVVSYPRRYDGYFKNYKGGVG